MCSTPSRQTEAGSSPAAAATAERIRDAAISRFGRDGFSAGLRVIGADAGVTAALVVHYFGSKEGLRRACDAHVLEVIRSEKMRAVTGSMGGMVAQLAQIEEYAPFMLYAMRSLQAGGDLAVEFVDQMCRDAEQYLAAGVESGIIRASRDPAGRARYLVMQSLGSAMLWMTLRSGFAGTDEFGKDLRAMSDEITLPALELFSEGLFADRKLLDEYLMYVCDPPGDSA